MRLFDKLLKHKSYEVGHIPTNFISIPDKRLDRNDCIYFNVQNENGAWGSMRIPADKVVARDFISSSKDMFTFPSLSIIIDKSATYEADGFSDGSALVKFTGEQLLKHLMKINYEWNQVKDNSSLVSVPFDDVSFESRKSWNGKETIVYADVKMMEPNKETGLLEHTKTVRIQGDDIDMDRSADALENKKGNIVFDLRSPVYPIEDFKEDIGVITREDFANNAKNVELLRVGPENLQTFESITLTRVPRMFIDRGPNSSSCVRIPDKKSCDGYGRLIVPTDSITPSRQTTLPHNIIESKFDILVEGVKVDFLRMNEKGVTVCDKVTPTELSDIWSKAWVKNIKSPFEAKDYSVNEERELE